MRLPIRALAPPGHHSRPAVRGHQDPDGVSAWRHDGRRAQEGLGARRSSRMCVAPPAMPARPTLMPNLASQSTRDSFPGPGSRRRPRAPCCSSPRPRLRRPRAAWASHLRSEVSSAAWAEVSSRRTPLWVSPLPCTHDVRPRLSRESGPRDPSPDALARARAVCDRKLTSRRLACLTMQDSARA